MNIRPADAEARRLVIDWGTHWHWLIWAYTSFDGNEYKNVVALDVLATDREEALAKAATIYPMGSLAGTGYVVRSVVEHLEGACAKP